MGHRANYVIIKTATACAFYDSWGAIEFPRAFTGGPEAATRHAEQFTPTDRLLDWAWAEGGYLIDYDERVALIFGFPVKKKERFLKQHSRQWNGWKLIWDDHGVDAFSEHLHKRSIDSIQTPARSSPSGCLIIQVQT